MAGLDDNTAVIGDWTPNPSPRTFLSHFLNEEFGTKSFSDLLDENGSETNAEESDKIKSITGSKGEGNGVGIQLSDDDLSFMINSFNVQKSSSRGGLTERIAARAGFNAPKLNTARIRSASMISSPSEICSPYVTIPNGLSPTVLLDSPVFLSNSTAQPSPTTGKFPMERFNYTNSGLRVLHESKECSFDDMPSESFAFKPHPESSSLFFSNVDNKRLSNIDHHQQLPNISLQPEPSTRARTLESGPVNFQRQQESNPQAGRPNSSEKKDVGDDITFDQRVSDSFMCKNVSPPLDDQPDGVADPKGEFTSFAAGAPADDGYNWRKYGQKQVKGSEYPRSYYKCTQPNCQVKKKVERSHEGHITEIIYKGAHNHPKPSPNRRSSACHLSNDPHYDGSEHPGLLAGHDWRSDALDVTLPASGLAEFCDPSTSMQTQDDPLIESSDAVDVSSTLSNDEDEDDQATHGSASVGGDGEGDETESKRRKLDTCMVEMSAASRTVREPRVVVQTTSEVDILDDGYRWRKYGQKVVKGNPNPRSYYKCTSPGCVVRKHVERASHDLKSVITTYEGKHNHEVPAARNNNTSQSLPATTVPQAHGLPLRPDLTQDSLMRFDGRPQLGAFGPPTGFGFGMMPQHDSMSLGMAGLSSMSGMKMPDFPSSYSFNGSHRRVEGGFAMEPKEEPLSESGIPMSSGASVYRQMMGRLPLGPQL